MIVRFSFSYATPDMTVQRGTTVQMRVEVTDNGSVDENDDWKVNIY
jgi:hypothetical protein